MPSLPQPSGPQKLRAPSLRFSFGARVGGREPRQARRRINIQIVLIGAIMSFFIGCKPVGPDYSKPVFTAPAAYKETGAPSVVPPPAPTDGSWKPASPSDGLLRGKWWELYNDPHLNQLEDRIAPNNQARRQAGDS